MVSGVAGVCNLPLCPLWDSTLHQEWAMQGGLPEQDKQYQLTALTILNVVPSILPRKLKKCVSLFYPWVILQTRNLPVHNGLSMRNTSASMLWPTQSIHTCPVQYIIDVVTFPCLSEFCMHGNVVKRHKSLWSWIMKRIFCEMWYGLTKTVAVSVWCVVTGTVTARAAIYCQFRTTFCFLCCLNCANVGRWCASNCDCLR